jgi:hypothetical protein
MGHVLAHLADRVTAMDRNPWLVIAAVLLAVALVLLWS